jgi:hypothetical protein
MTRTTHNFLRTMALLPTLLPPFLSADTITMSDGTRKTGRVAGVEQEVLVLSAQPVPGLPTVELRFPKARITAIEFEENAQRDALIHGARQSDLPEIALLWERFVPLLTAPGSPSARIGLRYGLLLLEAGPPGGRTDPLPLFERIAGSAPSPAEREAAMQGVLRSLLSTRQWARAENEALSVARSACGTPLLAEARLTIGFVQSARLRELLRENPRWQEDDFVRPERNRLHDSALDGLLGAALLPGVPPEMAARGLLGALRVYEMDGDLPHAKAVSTDIASLHPTSKEAASAREWLNANPAPSQPKPN